MKINGTIDRIIKKEGISMRSTSIFTISKQVLIIVIASVIVVASLGFATFFALRANDSFRNEKKKAIEQGYKLYIVIEQYEVKDYSFSGNQPIEILFKEEFTDDLEHQHKYENEHGHNTVKIKDGKVQIIEADCRDRRCTRGYLTNKNSLFEVPSLICYPNGIKVKWEIDYSGNLDTKVDTDIMLFDDPTLLHIYIPQNKSKWEVNVNES